MNKLITILMATVMFWNTAAHSEIHVRQDTSNYDADIKYKVVDYGGKKWYIGKCMGDLTSRSERIAIKEVSYSGGDVVKVTLVSKSRARMILCMR